MAPAWGQPGATRQHRREALLGKLLPLSTRSRSILAPLPRRSRSRLARSSRFFRRTMAFEPPPRSGFGHWARTPRARLAITAVMLMALVWWGSNYRSARHDEESRAASAELQRLTLLYLDIGSARDELRRRANAMAARFFADSPPLPVALTQPTPAKAAINPPTHMVAAAIDPAPQPAAALVPVALGDETVVEDGPAEQTVEVQKGDTLLDVLLNAGVTQAQAHDAVDALK